MDTEISKTIKAVDKKAQYDQYAKKLLGHKIILAHILAKTVDEFKGMDPKEIVPYIEGDPMIGKVPIDPGLTNISKEKIVGFNTEDSTVNEGLVRFDIIFYVRMKDGLSQIIINVEAQKDEPSEYDILNRAIFYVCRKVSSQKERDFKQQEYNKIKRVYSIWICMNMPENCMNHFQLTDHKLLGNYNWKGDPKILNIIMLGVRDELPNHDDENELHRLLGAIFSRVLTATEKLDILETEYKIPVKKKMREEINIMCNLSQGIVEQTTRTVTKDVTEQVKRELIMNMYEEGDSLEKIARVTGKSVEEVKLVIGEKKLN